MAIQGDIDSYPLIPNPPDTMGTVGKNHVLTMLNQAVKIQTKSGESIFFTNSLEGFWRHPNVAAANIGEIVNIFDPRTTYDPFHDRWIATALVDGRRTNTSGILLAVSLTDDPHPTNGWHSLRVDADTNKFLWVDQPTLGFNKDWIVMQGNMVPSLGVEAQASYFWVFNKTNLYAGGTNFARLFHNDPERAGNERPALTYDNSLDKVYLIQNADGNFNGDEGLLRLFSISGPINAPTLNNVEATNALYISVQNSASETVTWANNVSTNLYVHAGCCSPQASVTNTIGTAPDARFDSVVYRAGSLWCAHTVYLPATNVARSAVQWWQINPEYKLVRQRGRVDDASGVNFYAFPSVAVNQFGDVLIGYSSFSTNQYASANYSFRPFYFEANKLYLTLQYKAGKDIYIYGRWGDYSATTVDPSNDTDLWTIQQYAEIITTPGFGDSWGTEWAHVAIALPSNDVFTAAATITGKFGNTNCSNLRATLENLEPAHGGNTNSPSVWFSWTAPTNGQVYFSITNTAQYARPLDSVLAVYAGASVTNLAGITNHHGGVSGSQVAFCAVSNTTYHLAVAGFNNTMGDFTLYWNQPTPPFFLEHPQSTNVVAAESVTFISLANGVAILHATNAEYSIANPQQTAETNQFFYSVMASNSLASATSQVALLMVHESATAKITNTTFTAEGHFVMHVHGVTNRPYTVETTTNLNGAIQWVPAFTNYVSFNYTNSITSNDVARFYRVFAEPIE